MMTPIAIALAAAATLCGTSATLFCLLYEQTRHHKKRLWWQTEIGRNIMALGASIAVLSFGTVLRLCAPNHHAGELVLVIGYTLVLVVMVWRTVTMWHANHPPRK